jgi:hypothetical protein
MIQLPVGRFVRSISSSEKCFSRKQLYNQPCAPQYTIGCVQTLSPHQGEIKFGNNATIDHVSQRTQQLSYDSAPTNQAESALFFQNESKIDHASKQLMIIT